MASNKTTCVGLAVICVPDPCCMAALTADRHGEVLAPQALSNRVIERERRLPCPLI